MDGHFVPNLTFGPKMVADLRRATRLPLDVHLMIERPEAWVARFREAGADYLTIHVEATADAVTALRTIRSCGARPAIALRPFMPIAVIDPFFDLVDLVLVMSVEPGFRGPAFIEGSLERVAAVARLLRERGLAPELQVDGGVKPEHCTPLAGAGATVLVVGSGIYLDPDGVGVSVERYRRMLVNG